MGWRCGVRIDEEEGQGESDSDGGGEGGGKGEGGRCVTECEGV